MSVNGRVAERRREIPADTLSYRPQEVSRFTLQLIEERRAGGRTGLPLGIPDLDEVINPLQPEELVVVMASTSNGKSSFMNYVARKAASRIGPEENRIVVKVTWEQSIEYDTLGYLAAESGLSMTRLARGQVDAGEWGSLQKAAIGRAVTPIWLVGHSAVESRVLRRRRPRLTMTDVARALEWIADKATDYNLTFDLIVLDYLQRIEAEHDERTEAYTRIVDRAKDAAIAFGCPVMLGCQARREVMDREWALPTARDGLYTSNIEHSAQVIIPLWLPKTTRHTHIDGPNGREDVTPNLLVSGVEKQTLGEAPVTKLLYFEPTHNVIGGWGGNRT